MFFKQQKLVYLNLNLNDGFVYYHILNAYLYTIQLSLVEFDVIPLIYFISTRIGTK